MRIFELKRSAASTLLNALPLVCAAVLCMPPAVADERFQLNEQALASLEFEGQKLPVTLEAFKKQFPAAQLDPERGNEKLGLLCYTVNDFSQSDRAQFYFCDDRLYQFETQYSLAGLEKLGGANVLLNQLLKAWGPADHAGESRWTWQRPMYSRRADFYAWPEKAKLTITNTDWTPIVTARLTKSRVQPPDNLGF